MFSHGYYFYFIQFFLVIALFNNKFQTLHRKSCYDKKTPCSGKYQSVFMYLVINQYFIMNYLFVTRVGKTPD